MPTACRPAKDLVFAACSRDHAGGSRLGLPWAQEMIKRDFSSGALVVVSENRIWPRSVSPNVCHRFQCHVSKCENASKSNRGAALRIRIKYSSESQTLDPHRSRYGWLDFKIRATLKLIALAMQLSESLRGINCELGRVGFVQPPLLGDSDQPQPTTIDHTITALGVIVS